VRWKTIKLPGFIGAIFEHIGVERDAQTGLKRGRRHQMIASLEHGRRLPRDRALLALKTRILVIKMATGIAECSALRKKTLIGQQGSPCLLNARREIFAGNIARWRAAFATPQQIGQCDPSTAPDPFDLMIHVAEERCPLELIRILLAFNRTSPIKRPHHSSVTQYQIATPKLRRQANDQRAEHVIAARGVLVRSEERRVGKECRSRWSP